MIIEELAVASFVGETGSSGNREGHRNIAFGLQCAVWVRAGRRELMIKATDLFIKIMRSPPCSKLHHFTRC